MLYFLLLCLPLTVAFYEPPPPPYTDIIGTARWVVKYCNYTIMSTHSQFLNGYPFAINTDAADGAYNETASRGIPYIYTSPLESVYHDFLQDPRVSFIYSAQFTHYCTDKRIDNGSPTCAKVVLSGEIEKMAEGPEMTWARDSMFVRHPDTKLWPVDHGFTFFKLKIKNVFAMDFYGGPNKHINITEYLNYKPKWSVVF